MRNQCIIGKVAYLWMVSPATLLHGAKDVGVEAQFRNDASNTSLGDVLALRDRFKDELCRDVPLLLKWVDGEPLP